MGKVIDGFELGDLFTERRKVNFNIMLLPGQVSKANTVTNRLKAISDYKQEVSKVKHDAQLIALGLWLTSLHMETLSLPFITTQSAKFCPCEDIVYSAASDEYSPPLFSGCGVILIGISMPMKGEDVSKHIQDPPISGRQPGFGYSI